MNFSDCIICQEPMDGTSRLIQFHSNIPCQQHQCHYVHNDCFYNDAIDINTVQGRNFVSRCPICSQELGNSMPRRIALGSYISEDGNLHPPAPVNPPEPVIGGKTKKYKKRRKNAKTKKHKKRRKCKKY